jgi:hypothetical protein
MPTPHVNNYPKLHNAGWPGLVGKGPDSEPPIDLDTMIALTTAANVDGVKFDGMDLFLFDPHVNIDIDDDGLKKLADKFRSSGLNVGSVVAPIWPPTGGGSAMGSEADRKKFVEAVRKGCRIAEKLRQLGVRPYGVVRIDSAAGPNDWYNDPMGNQKKIAQTFREAADVAEGVVGFQADMAHTLLYTMGYNAPEDPILPEGYDWKDGSKLDEALKTLTHALRPWTIDFHVAQNNGTVHGSGSHDKTGRHCQATDPTGKLDIPKHAGYWLRNESGAVIKRFKHICWDGCMFPNAVMMDPKTWNDILKAMVAVRDRHGWVEGK